MSSDDEEIVQTSNRNIQRRESLHNLRSRKQRNSENMEQAEPKEVVVKKKNNRKTPVPIVREDQLQPNDTETNSTSQSVEEGDLEHSADEIDGTGQFNDEPSSINLETEDTTNDQHPLTDTKKECIPHIKVKENMQPKHDKTIYIQICVIIGLIIALICKLWVKPIEIIPVSDEPKTCDEFMQMKAQYPQLEDFLWKSLIVNVDNALYKNPGNPGTFIFLYNTSNTEKEFMKDIVRITKKCTTGDIQPIDLSSSDLNTPEFIDDHGIFITRYRKQLEKNMIMIVHDLSQISPEVVQAFHSFCDNYDPIVGRAMIFFTLDIRKVNESTLKNKNALKISEDYLHELWDSSLKSHVLDPLIARLTENVFFIY